MSDSGIDLEFDVAGHPGGQASSVSLDVLASATLDLPGLTLAVEKLRASLSLGLSLVDGRLGLTPPTLQITPPAGASAQLGLPGFGGGGYLAHDGDEWSGALSAQLGPVSISGFGLLTTDRFSMLVLLAAEFIPPIQLSFGFTLVGIGGLVGINRHPDTDALTAAVSSGALSDLLFPSDPVADAPRLLPTLDACFPYSSGDFIVGPMLKLGWGTPTLVAATLGVLVGSDGVVIVGRIALTLPFEEAALIRLQALVLGIINADGLAIDASLAGSQIVGIPVEGDIRLRIRTGSDALFAFSAGGFHPAFTPPEGMAGMARIGAELSPGPILRTRLGLYLAVTSDSVQFGAHIEMEAGFDGFGISGHFDFDALIILDPFGFTVDFSAGVSIECADFTLASIDLGGHFSGPSPWRISAHASISILFFSVDVDLPELTWGSADPPPLPPARDPLAVLLHEIGVPGNWTATSRDVPALVQLAPGVAADQAAIHPMAELAFRESAVPLDIELQLMDGLPLGTPVTLTAAAAGGDPALVGVVADFVPSQFRTADDKARLAGAGYASFDGGFDVDPTGARTGPQPQGRDDIRPKTAVVGVEYFVPYRIGAALTVGLVTGIGHTAVPAVAPAPLFSLRDPGSPVVADVLDLAVAVPAATAALAASGNAGVTEGLLTAAAGTGAASARNLGGQDLQVARAWELA